MVDLRHFHLLRFIPESARNSVGTDETVPLLLAARARTHIEPPNVTGEEKAHGPTGTRTQDLLQTTEHSSQLSYQATWSTCDNLPLLRFIPESARNSVGTDETVPLLLAAETVPLLLAARARTHTEPPNVTGEEKAHGPTGTRTQDLLQTTEHSSQLSYQATWSTCDNLPLLRFIPESARNSVGTDETVPLLLAAETVPLLLAARARTHTEPPNVTGEEKAHGPTGTRTQDLSHTMRAL